MSGPLQSAILLQRYIKNPSAMGLTLTLANGGSAPMPNMGWQASGFGTLKGNVAFRGCVLTAVRSARISGPTEQFVIRFSAPYDAVPAQDFFTRVEVEDGAGAQVVLHTVDAVFSTASDYVWTWDTSPVLVWDDPDIGDVRSVIII